MFHKDKINLTWEDFYDLYKNKIKDGFYGGLSVVPEEPILKDYADVVYGSRFIGSEEKRVLFFWHSLGNKLLTLMSNMLTNLNLTDMENCYKVFTSEIITSIDLTENRFGFEPEVTAKISRKQLRIFEVGVRYYGRKYSEGKKITWRDGFSAIRCIIRYNLFTK